MQRLDEIEKKNFYNVPEGYFESLPAIIQSRVAGKSLDLSFSWVSRLKYALPILAISISLFWFYKSQSDFSPEDLLASISSEDIADYLHSIEIPADDFMESLDYSQLQVDSLDLNESNILLEDADVTGILIELKEEPSTTLHE
jgi:hypothetical protein